MNGKTLNPGSINVRLGSVLAREEEAMARGDLATASNLQGVAGDYLSIYMDAKELASFDAMPNLAYGDGRSHAQVTRDLGARRRYLMVVARRHGVFARAPEPETGDSDILDQEEEATA